MVLETLGNDIVQSPRFFASGRLFSKYRCRGTRQEDDGLYLSRSFCVQNITLDDFLEACVLLLHNCPNFSSQTRSERRS